MYNTECNIIPEFVHELEDHTKMYKPEVDLTLTCVTFTGDEVLENAYDPPSVPDRHSCLEQHADTK